MCMLAKFQVSRSNSLAGHKDYRLISGPEKLDILLAWLNFLVYE